MLEDATNPIGDSLPEIDTDAERDQDNQD